MTNTLDVQQLRHDFRILERTVCGKRLVYLDNAATTHKPQCVIDALSSFYYTTNSNIHRGIHTLSEEATAAYEGVRKTVARFINAPDPQYIIYTRNTTESLNLVAQAWGSANLNAGDEILITEMEHHSNLVPWFQIAERTGAVVKHLPVNPEDGTLRMEELDAVLTEKTRIFSFTAVSNVLGTINPVKELVSKAHEVGAVALVDAAQAAPHMALDVQDWDADFVAFSSHKMLGPTGVGILWGRKEILDAMPPYMGGGEMIHEVFLDRFTTTTVPHRFEAGTPNIADTIVFGTAIEYLEKVGMDVIRQHEIELTQYAMDRLDDLGFLRIFGPRDMSVRGGVVTFDDPEVHPHDLSTLLDQHGIAIRAGHHCAQPLMRCLGTVATARASFYIYNDRDDVDALAEALVATRKYFGHAVS